MQVASGKFWVSLSLTLSILNWNVLFFTASLRMGECCKAESFCPSSWCFLPMIQMRTERPSEDRKPTQSQISDTCRLRFNFWGNVGTFLTSVADSLPKMMLPKAPRIGQTSGEKQGGLTSFLPGLASGQPFSRADPALCWHLSSPMCTPRSHL